MINTFKNIKRLENLVLPLILQSLKHDFFYLIASTENSKHFFVYLKEGKILKSKANYDR